MSFPKSASVWVAVALREVAENLIVGAVLADDVEHVLDRRARADRLRDRRADRSVRRIEPDRVAIRRERVDRASVLGERRAIGRRHRTDGAEEPTDDSVIDRVRGRRHAFPAQDEHLLAVAAEDRAGRVGTGGNEAVHEAAPAVADVDDGDGVVVGVGDEQRLAIGRQGQRVGRRGRRRLREQASSRSARSPPSKTCRRPTPTKRCRTR